MTNVINEAAVSRQREDLAEHLSVVTKPSATSLFSKLLTVCNTSVELRYTVTYVFEAVIPIEALSQTKRKTRVNEQGKEENVFSIVVDPQQRLDFVCGPFTAYVSRNVAQGIPDINFWDQQRKDVDKGIDEAMGTVRILLRKNPTADGKYTSEYAGKMCSQFEIPFVDLNFPPKNLSLSRDWEGNPFMAKGTATIWHRPDDILRPTAKLRSILPHSALLGEVIAPWNVHQGTLGDCYFCCAMACLAQGLPQLVRDVFSLVQDNETGVYRALFCKNGWWQTVVIDSYLPTQGGRLCFARNVKEPLQLWPSFLEKAYAKLHGSFAAIRAGDSPSALMDLTGSSYKQFKQLPDEIFKNKDALFQAMFDWHCEFNPDRSSDAPAPPGEITSSVNLMVLSTPSKSSMDPEMFAIKSKQFDAVGLTLDHVYSVLRVAQVRSANGTVLRFVKLRDPWGGGPLAKVRKVWTGPWSRGSADWTPALRIELAYADDLESDDTTFWMQWEDAVRYFEGGGVCRVRRDWPHLRVMCPLHKGRALFALRVKVKTTVACVFGAHQRDRRGLPPQDDGKPVPQYVGLLLTVLGWSNATNAMTSVALTSDPKNTFGSYRDVFAEGSLVPLSSDDDFYIVVVQALNDSVALRQVVLSLTADDPFAFEELSIHQIDDGVAGSTWTSNAPYFPLKNFSASHYCKEAYDALWQVRLTNPFGDGVKLTSHTGSRVNVERDFALAAKRKKAKGASHVDPTEPTKSEERADVSPARATDTPAVSHHPPHPQPPATADCAPERSPPRNAQATIHMLLLDASLRIHGVSPSDSAVPALKVVVHLVAFQSSINALATIGSVATRWLPCPEAAEESAAAPLVTLTWCEGSRFFVDCTSATERLDDLTVSVELILGDRTVESSNNCVCVARGSIPLSALSLAKGGNGVVSDVELVAEETAPRGEGTVRIGLSWQ